MINVSFVMNFTNFDSLSALFNIYTDMFMVNDTLGVEFNDLFSDYVALFLNSSNLGALNVWNEIQIDVTELNMYYSSTPSLSSNTYDVIDISMSCWKSVGSWSFIGVIFCYFCQFLAV